ncbi:MAG: hypothetical protein M5U12_24875 [Verrucomicrobia bacterium]|nr:hypothetical protein [Verrucomicrobiota bacterium]
MLGLHADVRLDSAGPEADEGIRGGVAEGAAERQAGDGGAKGFENGVGKVLEVEGGKGAGVDVFELDLVAGGDAEEPDLVGGAADADEADRVVEGRGPVGDWDWMRRAKGRAWAELKATRSRRASGSNRHTESAGALTSVMVAPVGMSKKSSVSSPWAGRIWTEWRPATTPPAGDVELEEFGVEHGLLAARIAAAGFPGDPGIGGRAEDELGDGVGAGSVVGAVDGHGAGGDDFDVAADDGEGERVDEAGLGGGGRSHARHRAR